MFFTVIIIAGVNLYKANAIKFHFPLLLVFMNRNLQVLYFPFESSALKLNPSHKKRNQTSSEPFWPLSDRNQNTEIPMIQWF